MRELSIASLIFLVFLALVPCVSAQGIAQGEIVVPTFNVFSVGTTISVPDRGGMVLGGSSRLSTTRTEFGPGVGRGFASRSAAADVSARVWIHDFQELEPSGGKPGDEDQSLPRNDFAAGLGRYASASTGMEKKPPVSEQRLGLSSHDQKAPSKAEQAADLLKRGQNAENRGKTKIARLYYQSVAALGSTPSNPEAQNRLRLLNALPAGRP